MHAYRRALQTVVGELLIISDLGSLLENSSEHFSRRPLKLVAVWFPRYNLMHNYGELEIFEGLEIIFSVVKEYYDEDKNLTKLNTYIHTYMCFISSSRDCLSHV
jgi:hypothetical protein